ncbi:unnamed protein product, partial [Staurois parvus]
MSCQSAPIRPCTGVIQHYSPSLLVSCISTATLVI